MHWVSAHSQTISKVSAGRLSRPTTRSFTCRNRASFSATRRVLSSTLSPDSGCWTALPTQTTRDTERSIGQSGGGSSFPAPRAVALSRRFALPVFAQGTLNAGAVLRAAERSDARIQRTLNATRARGLRASCGSAAHAPSPWADPRRRGLAFELKWDGFRAIVSTENDLRVRSRRGC